MIPAIEVRRDNCRAAAARGFSTATDLADYLVNKGLPFRDAHHVVGSTVAFAQQKGCDIAELSLAELRTFSELIGEDVYAKITLEGSLDRKSTRLTPVTNAHLVCRLLLEKKKINSFYLLHYLFLSLFIFSFTSFF